MLASRPRTLWIMILSGFSFLSIFWRALWRYYFGRLHREWINKTILAWSYRILRYAEIEFKVVNHNQYQIPSGRPIIVMSNHTSLYDIPLSFVAFPNLTLRMLSKIELSKIPLMGKTMKVCECVFVDRGNRQKAIQNLVQIRQLLEEGVSIWIAPEGTRSKTGKLAPFKKGGFITAIQTNAVIIPMGIVGAYEILPPRTHRVNLGQKAEIRIGEAIDAGDYTLENKEELLERVHLSMEKLLS